MARSVDDEGENHQQNRHAQGKAGKAFREVALLLLRMCRCLTWLRSPALRCFFSAVLKNEVPLTKRGAFHKGAKKHWSARRRSPLAIYRFQKAYDEVRSAAHHLWLKVATEGTVCLPRGIQEEGLRLHVCNISCSDPWCDMQKRKSQLDVERERFCCASDR